MSTQPLPEAFVWSKMGSEGGEDLSAILRRKDLERGLGDGLFVWGIGNALGDSVHALAALAVEPRAVFTPMVSKAKHHDVAPDEVVIWGAYEGSAGEAVPLPSHVIVTSRGRSCALSKLRHYALFCHSMDSIGAVAPYCQEVVPAHHRNLVSGRPLGASQVTAVVRRTSGAMEAAVRSYPVAFSAILTGPRYAKLLRPRIATDEEIKAMAGGSNSIQEWQAVVARIRTPTQLLNGAGI